jgi:hypothetical protein
LRRSFASRWKSAGGEIGDLILVMGYPQPSVSKNSIPDVQQYPVATAFQSNLEDPESI